MRAVRLTVLGAGSWGTALAALACRHSETMIWARDTRQAAQIAREQVNTRYLPDIRLPDSLRATADLATALNHVLHAPADTDRLIVLGVPMAGLADVCRQLALALPADETAPVHILWTCKGISPDTREWPHEIVARHLRAQPWHHVGVLSGDRKSVV